MYAGSYGLDLVFKLSTDLSWATSADLLIKPPSSGGRERPSVTKTATITDFVQGTVTYRTVDGDFENVGVYQLQVAIYKGVERKLRSEIVEVDVEQALD